MFIWFGALRPLGLGLLVRSFIRVSLFKLAVQMPRQTDALFLLPDTDICFTQIPFGLTLEGQYIIKNVTLISAAIVVGGTVRHQSDERKIL